MKTIKQLEKEIRNGCGSKSLWTDYGERFFRKCNDSNKYSILKGKDIVGKCKPKLCASCRLGRIPFLESKLSQTKEIVKMVENLKSPKDEEAPYTGEWAMGVNETCDNIILKIKGKKSK